MRFILTGWSNVDGDHVDEIEAADWTAALARTADVLSGDVDSATLHQVAESRDVDVNDIHARRKKVREEQRRQQEERKRLASEANDRATYERLKAKFEPAGPDR